MTLRRFRPLELGDIFDEAFDLYKKNFSLLLLVAAVTAVPLKIGAAFVSLSLLRSLAAFPGLGSGGGASDPMQVFGWLSALFSGAALLTPIYLIVYGLEYAALAQASSARYLGEACSLRDAYRPVLRRFLPLVGTAWLYGLAMLAGYIVCIVGILVPATLLLFSAHIFVREGVWGSRALKRSNALVSGQGSRVFGVLVLAVLLELVLKLGIEVPFNYALGALLSNIPGTETVLGGAHSLAAGISLREQIINSIGEGLSEVLIAPFLLCVLTVFYYDLRVRREAFDIELMARDLNYPPLVTGTFLPPAAPMLPSGLASTLPPTPERPR